MVVPIFQSIQQFADWGTHGIEARVPELVIIEEGAAPGMHIESVTLIPRSSQIPRVDFDTHSRFLQQ